MELDEFKEKLLEGIKNNHIQLILDDDQIKLLFWYMKYILKTNESINLTAITNEEEFIYKHYIDSLYLVKYINKGKLLDIGTGAGFPGMPLLLILKDLQVTFLDSKNKKLKVIKKFVKENNVNNATFIHTRAESLNKDFKYINSFDYVTTRAVSNIENVTSYSIPYLKEKGLAIAMRGIINELDEKNIKRDQNITETIKYKIKTNNNLFYDRTILIIKNEVRKWE